MRFDTLSNRMRAMGLVFALVAVVAPWLSVHAETITIGGTGTAGAVVERFAQAYSKLRPDITIRVVNPPMGSNGSIRALLAGSIDLAVPGRPLADTERTQGGQDRELGRTGFVVVTSKEPQPPGLTVAQLAAIYAGKVTAWADGSPIRLVLRSPTETDLLVLRKLSPAMDAAVEAALGRAGMLVAANDLENVELLEKTPGSLGASSLALVQSENRRLHALPIEGVAPTLSAVRQGTYPYTRSLYVVSGPKLSLAAKGFLEFMLAAPGKDVLDRAGYLPASR